VIRYRLRCSAAHEFEAWFPSSQSYDAQADAGRVSCPECGSAEVEKAIMAPNVASGVSRREPVAAMPAEMREALREIREAVIARAEDVGTRFPEEARRIHYSEDNTRAIRGTASRDEVRELLDEGIEVVAIPHLPEDAN